MKYRIQNIWSEKTAALFNLDMLLFYQMDFGHIDD